MVETYITKEDIAALSRKMDELGDVLSAKERSLLLAVFKLAGTAVAARLKEASGVSEGESGRGTGVGIIGGTTPPVSPLSEGFRNAFQPIGGADFTVRDNLEKVAGGVGIGVVW